MKVTLDSTIYRIYWRYAQEKYSACFIVDDQDNLVGEGIACRCGLDRWDKAVGRKIAFSRALEEAGFNSRQRKEFWLAFHNTIKRSTVTAN
jgi:hypothetical protein